MPEREEGICSSDSDTPRAGRNNSNARSTHPKLETRTTTHGIYHTCSCLSQRGLPPSLPRSQSEAHNPPSVRPARHYNHWHVLLSPSTPTSVTSPLQAKYDHTSGRESQKQERINLLHVKGKKDRNDGAGGGGVRASPRRNPERLRYRR